MVVPMRSKFALSTLCFTLVLNLFNFTAFSINSDGLHLLKVKRSLFDPTGFFSGWSNRDDAPCNWTGITCNDNSSVVSVVLANASLSGPFPIDVCRLPALVHLSLHNNEINSSLPGSISDCRRLDYLDLSSNLIVGPIPETLPDIPPLRFLNLESNNFSGEIPVTFGRFQRLEVIRLTENLLSGAIPASMGNITSLKRLLAAYNQLSGELPPELGGLFNLEELWISNCLLTGQIPESFGGLRQLRNLDVSNNKLTGPVNTVVMQLTNVVQIELYNNSFSGILPTGWSNFTNLRRFDGSMNHFTGTIPSELCELPLESLNLFQNNLEGVIPASIANSPNLYELKLFGNRLSGTLPSDLGKNSGLKVLDVSYNNLSGELPRFLCKNGVLRVLGVIDNGFSGSIPSNLGKCKTLERVRMHGNKFRGEVPAGFWDLPKVLLLELSKNALSGNISHLIRGAESLTNLDISFNKFSGNIPGEIGSLDSLVVFDASNNELSGEIPGSIVNLEHLAKLDLNNNNLSGGVPTGIQNMRSLNELDLANNGLSGQIPSEIGSLPVLNYLDLSCNNFSGSIPLSLQSLKLNQLNLSNNMLSGVIPPLLARGVFFKDSFLGNPGLCMDAFGLCKPAGRHDAPIFSWLLMSIVSVGVVSLLVGVVWFLFKYMSLNQLSKEVALTKWTSFHKLDFTESEIYACLKEANVIGRGATGSVYKAILSNGETVAVKKMLERTAEDVLNGDASDVNEFHVEVETLGCIRHKNIVKLWCCCDMGSCKLIVYEYMPNGSLGDMLHNNTKVKFLDWPTRFKIALDAAEGLSYLHHDSVPPIVHRDVKSNNILLGEDFGAKISDFGVAKMIRTVSDGCQPMSVIAGTCGYIAPEYAYTLRVNEKSDIYSFGIVILELVTGKPPVSTEYGDKDLSAWVCSAIELEGIDYVLDPKLDTIFRDHMTKFLDIGLLCTTRLPNNRPCMRRVVNMLQELGSNMPVAPEKAW